MVSSKCPQAPKFIFYSKLRHLHRVLSLKVDRKWQERFNQIPSFWVEYECRGLWTLGWHHTSSMEACCVVSVVLLRLNLWSPVSSIVLDSALAKFTPETPEVFCGLKHFTHPPIGIVVSKWWVNFSFLGELLLCIEPINGSGSNFYYIFLSFKVVFTEEKNKPRAGL